MTTIFLACPPPKHASRTSIGEALNRDNDISRVPPAEAPAVSVLAQVHPLPRAEGQLAVRDRDIDRRSDQSALKTTRIHKGPPQRDGREVSNGHQDWQAATQRRVWDQGGGCHTPGRIRRELSLAGLHGDFFGCRGSCLACLNRLGILPRATYGSQNLQIMVTGIEDCFWRTRWARLNSRKREVKF